MLLEKAFQLSRITEHGFWGFFVLFFYDKFKIRGFQIPMFHYV